MDADAVRDALGGADPAIARFDLRRDLIATTDGRCYFTSLNFAWERALGWTRDELASTRFTELLHPDDLGPSLALLSRVKEADLEVVAFENRLRRKDGTWAWLHWHARTDGEVWTGVASDISAERDAETMVASAIAEDRVLAYSQPIFDQRTGEKIQEELLVRISENDEVIPPASFLPAVEMSETMIEVDRWMIDRAFELADEGRPVAVNLSPRSVANIWLMEELRERIAERDEGEASVAFEITETAALGNLPGAGDFGGRLEKLDCELALDDFGTGSASFIHVRELPIDTIKIDRSFVSGLTDDETNRAVCRAVVGVANDLGLTTVAEGVEDEVTLEAVRELGVDRVQGFLFGRPAPV